MTGSQFWFVVAWENTSMGRYEGQVGPNGELLRPEMGSGRSGSEVEVARARRTQTRLRCTAGRRSRCVLRPIRRIFGRPGKVWRKSESGFTGARWSADYDLHWKWCRGFNGDQTLPNAEREARKVALKDCVALCQTYAAQAIAAAWENKKLGCGFTGPRWYD